MAVVSSGLTVGEVAKKSLVREPRLLNIVHGRTAPTYLERQRILEACDIAPGLLTRPLRFDLQGDDVLASGKPARDGKPMSASEALLSVLLARSDPTEYPITAESVPLVVDKLALTFNVSNEESFIDLAEDHGHEAASFSDIYQRRFRCGGLVFDHGLKSRSLKYSAQRSSRLEFNPAKSAASGPEFAVVQAMAAHGIFRDVRISRIDVAVDLPVTIREIQALGNGRFPARPVLGSDGVETIYYGTSRSAVEIAIYDRRRKLIEAGLAGPDHPHVTRIEARIRKAPTLDALRRLKNPFVRLHPIYLCGEGLPLPQRLLVQYAQTFGLPVLKAQLSKRDFSKLVADLQRLSPMPSLPLPEEVFAKKWQLTARRLLRALGVHRR
jgi:hypothetical protein